MVGCFQAARKGVSHMADQNASGVSQSDIESLGKKLEQFNQSLTPGEKAALVEILKRAQPLPQEGDVQGFMFAEGTTATTASSSIHIPALVTGAFAIKPLDW
jgi:hypothetical protein